MKHIMNIGTLLTKTALISLLIIALPSAQAAKGGGGKVSVTAAEPGEALQGEELDVIVSGSGFDDGSTATYLVTGTNDDTQIEILSNEYLPATGQLKTRIKVNGGATVIDYDIEVTNSRGRRGKGTTLFKVKSLEAPNYAFLHAEYFAGLAVMEVDAQNYTQLLDRNEAWPEYPVWLPDGEHIAWIEKGGTTRLVRAKADGSEITVLASTSETLILNPDYKMVDSSFDGCGDGSQILYLLARERTNPDGDRGNDIYSIDPFDTGSLTSLTNGDEFGHEGIALSPDGQLAALWTRHVSNATAVNGSIEIRDLCQVGLPVLWSWTMDELGFPAGDSVTALDWSSEAVLAVETVNYTNNPDYKDDQNIWIIDLFPPGGSSAVSAYRLTGSGGLVAKRGTSISPSWSPDGRKLVFSYFRRTKPYPNIYDFDTGTITQISNRQTFHIDWRDNWQPNPLAGGE